MKHYRNLIFHDKLKQIEIKYHYIQNIVYGRAMWIKCVPTDELVVDVLTKSLSQMKLIYFIKQLGFAKNPYFREREHWLYNIIL